MIQTSSMGIPLALLLAFIALPRISAQSCTTTDCTSACLLFDDSWTRCNYDYTGKGFDSLTSCLCQWNNLQTTVKALAQCTSCQQDGLGSNPLARYELWTVICNTYENEGETNALEIGNMAASQVVDLYTSSYLPVIQSAYCGQVISTTTTTTSIVVRTSTTSAVVSSGGASRPAWSSPTSTVVNKNQLKMAHVIGLLTAVMALWGFAAMF